jgi:Arc/MetJ family transcription regulator
MPGMSERTNIRLDEQAKTDARRVMRRYNLRSVSAAVRFALREMARQIEVEGDKVTDRVTPAATTGETPTGGQENTAP